MEGSKHKQYIGDSVYVDFDGYHIVLTTENGYGPSNKIMLEPAVMQALFDYQEWLKGLYSKQEEPSNGGE